MLMKENLIEKKYFADVINVTNIDNTLMDFIFQFCNVRLISNCKGRLSKPRNSSGINIHFRALRKLI